MTEKETKRAADVRRERGEARTNQMERTQYEKGRALDEASGGLGPFPGVPQCDRREINSSLSSNRRRTHLPRAQRCVKDKNVKVKIKSQNTMQKSIK